VHAEQLALYGGADGIRDLGMLESALGRPLNDVDIAPEQAAASLAVAAGEVSEESFARWIRDNWPAQARRNL
jgi:death-on-curing protein